MQNQRKTRLLLSVVMPVYSEEHSIGKVVSSWLLALDSLRVAYEFLAFDDGSRDRTGAILEELAAEHAAMVVTRQSNRGHGPTILRGYRQARGEWVLQIDSDGEMGPEALPELWAKREGFDFLVGYRQHRRSSPARQLVTLGSRLTVRLLFGHGAFHDVNSPYRLMRRQALAKLLPLVPDTTFAPNVILCGLAALTEARTYECPVEHRGQRTVTKSLNKWRLWKTAMRCLRETAAAAFRGRRALRKA